MTHFNEAQWADFARGLISGSMQTKMQEHLDSGCKSCGDTLRIWQNTLALSKEETNHTPPEDIVRVAKSQFIATTSLASGRIRLLFDSFLEPAATGVRGAISARQFLFETDELYIDLRVNPQAERLFLIGQIMDRAQTKQAVQDLPIFLHKGTAQVTGTKTNQFGEFQLEFDASADLCISIGLDKEQPIFLPLYGIYSKPLNTRGSA